MKKFRTSMMTLLLSTLLVGQSNVGTTAASFLDIGIGARSLAMGGAFTAVANDATALYWNPAGITNILQPTAHFYYAPWFVDIDFTHGAAVVPLGRMGTLGLSITSVTMDEMKVRTLQVPEGTGELFEVSNLALATTYARKLTDRFSFGLNIKLVQEKIWHMNANVIAADVGCLFVTKNKGIRIGMSISNFGSKMKLEGYDTERDFDIDETIFGNNDKIDSHLDTQGWPLPLVFRAGISKDVIDDKIHKLTLAGDAIHPNNNYEYLNLGLEYTFMGIGSIRAGQSYIFLDEQATSEEINNQFTFGAGLNYKIPRGPQIQLDYVLRDFGILHTVGGYSLNISF
jgi:long-subunit fatty acid transport protein